MSPFNGGFFTFLSLFFVYSYKVAGRSRSCKQSFDLIIFALGIKICIFRF
jgi:hypothetical protein